MDVRMSVANVEYNQEIAYYPQPEPPNNTKYQGQVKKILGDPEFTG